MMLHRAIIVVTLMMMSMSVASAADRAVVLVTGEDCAMEGISALEIRKAYLGVAVSYAETTIHAFRLANDAHLNQIFYQSIVAMSEKTYERRLLRLLLKYGQPRPREFDTPENVAAALAKNPCSIAYMWRIDANSWPDIRAIKILWQEN